MPYSDFEFYKAQFCGKVVTSKEEYCACAVKAGCYLDWLTNGKIKNMEKVPTEVLMAECAISELYFENDARRGIKSETNDGYRVDFLEPSEAEMYRTAVRYLPRELVFRGIGL